MICILRISILAVFLLAVSVNAADPPKPFLSKLKVGQEVSLKEANGRYEIIVMKRLSLGHRVVEVGEDYVELLDVSGVTTTIIPIYSIRSITKHELPQK